VGNRLTTSGPATGRDRDLFDSRDGQAATGPIRRGAACLAGLSAIGTRHATGGPVPAGSG
jgi:hypothetical protein